MRTALASAVLFIALAGCEAANPPMTCAPWGDSAALAERPSPYDSIMLFEDTALVAKLCYSRPLARGRVIFGELVPYDTLWRTGANEPTILHVARPSNVAGLQIQPGDYSLYTVPSPGRWTLVVNASTSQWGLTREERGVEGNLFPNAYTERVRAQELGRQPITTQAIPYVEQLTAGFERGSDSDYRLFFDWETVRIVVPLQIDSEGLE